MPAQACDRRVRSALSTELKAAAEHREAAERCNAIHAHHCPNARSVAAAIDIVTELDFVPAEEKAGAPA